MNLIRTGVIPCILLVWTSTSSFSAAEPPVVLNDLVAPITSSLGSVPEAGVDLGSLRIFDSVKLRIVLENRTSGPLRFDSIAKGCSCTGISPSRGKIEPGGTLTVTLTRKTPSGRATSLKQGGVLFFLDGKRQAFKVRFVYRIKSYVGFAGDLVLATIHSDDDKVRLIVPIVVGEDLSGKDFEISVEGIDGTFTYTVDRTDAVVRASLELDSEESFDRLYGSLKLLDLASGQLASVPLIVERASVLKVFPGSLRFTQSTENSPLFAKVYVRPSKPSESKRPRCLASARLGDSQLRCVTKKLGGGVFQILVEINPEHARELRETESEDVSGEVRPESVHLNVVFDSWNVDKNLPFSLMEFQP